MPSSAAIRVDSDWTVIVDMIAVDIVQVAIMDIVEMVAVRDHHMIIAVAMHVISVKRGGHRRFAIRVELCHRDHMFIDMSVMDKVKMAIMQIVPVIDVPDFRMSAIVAMDVSVIGVNIGRMRLRGDGTRA